MGDLYTVYQREEIFIFPTSAEAQLDINLKKEKKERKKEGNVRRRNGIEVENMKVCCEKK